MEQASDDQKFKWCKEETEKNAQSQKMKQDEVTDLTAQIGNLDADLHLLKDEAMTITKEIDELDNAEDFEELPYACRAGSCSACAAKLVSGTMDV